jgi:hypothetical protein
MNSEEEDSTILQEESTNVNSFADFGGLGWETSAEQPSKIAATETTSGCGISTDWFSNGATIETGSGWGGSGDSTAVQTSNGAATAPVAERENASGSNGFEHTSSGW